MAKKANKNVDERKRYFKIHANDTYTLKFAHWDEGERKTPLSIKNIT